MTMYDKTKKSRSGKQKDGWIWKDYCRKIKNKEMKNENERLKNERRGDSTILLQSSCQILPGIAL